MLESDVEAYLVRRVEELGGEVRKVKWIGRRFAPDRLVLLPQRQVEGGWGRRTEVPALIWVELKRPGKAATFPSNAHERGQAREHEALRRMGQRVVVIDSIEQIEELLQ